MFFGLLRKRASAVDDRADTLYAAIVAAARRPEFYADCGVPDSFPGRFELVVLHAALILRRLRQERADGQAELGQQVFDAMFRALEANLRELGVGDMAVPKRIKAMARSFFDGAKAYDTALDAKDERMLATAIERIVFGGKADEPDAPARLAAYALCADEALSAQAIDRLLADGPAFPPIEGFPS